MPPHDPPTDPPEHESPFRYDVMIDGQPKTITATSMPLSSRIVIDSAGYNPRRRELFDITADLPPDAVARGAGLSTVDLTERTVFVTRPIDPAK